MPLIISLAFNNFKQPPLHSCQKAGMRFDVFSIPKQKKYFDQIKVTYHPSPAGMFFSRTGLLLQNL